MSIINTLHATERTVEVEYPEIDGFFIELAYVGRDELTKISSRATKVQFSKVSRRREETLDDEKFLEEYSKKIIKGWRGLKKKDLEVLLPVDLKGVNEDDDVPYSEEEAFDLLRNSVPFDQFITDTISDLDTFRSEEKEENVKN